MNIYLLYLYPFEGFEKGRGKEKKVTTEVLPEKE